MRRMLRAPQILSLPARSLPPSAFSEQTAGVFRQGSKHAAEKKPDAVPRRDAAEGAEAPSRPDPHLRAASFWRTLATSLTCPTPPFYTSAKAKAVSATRNPDVDEGAVAEDVQGVRRRQGCYPTQAICLQARKRTRDCLPTWLGFPCRTRPDLTRSGFCHARHVATLSNRFSQHAASRPGDPSGRQASPRAAVDWRGFLSAENESRCRGLLGPNLTLYDGAGARGRGAGETQRRWASVLVSLCSVQGQPAFLFTLRSTSLGRNKGDVSFAGGKSDPSDPDVVATALRETWEELGVNVAEDRVWGVMKPLTDMRGMMVAPVLANLGPLEELSFKPNPGEVEEIFTLPLSHLCDPCNCGYTHFRTGDKYGYTLPVFHNGKHRVWGLTAVALDRTLKLVVPS